MGIVRLRTKGNQRRRQPRWRDRTVYAKDLVLPPEVPGTLLPGIV